MSKLQNSTFRFTGFHIRESHILFNGNEAEIQMEIKIIPTGIIYQSLNQFELLLDVYIKSKSGLFEATIKSNSFFDFDSDTSQELSPDNKFLTQNAPAIVFPYIRAYIGTLTAQSGVGVVLLPAMNLSSLADELQRNIRIE